MINEEIICLDNVLGFNVMKDIKNILYSSNFNWHYILETETGHNLDAGSFANVVFQSNHRIDPEISIKLEMCLMSALDTVKLKLAELLRIRVGMALKSNFVESHLPHVDNPHQHLVAIMYLTTCDAPTLIYNEQYDTTTPTIGSYEFYNKKLNSKVTIKQKIDCIENRMVIFNGSYYHSGTKPTNVGRRIVINFDFTTHD